ncbi:hypothetical protein [Absidia glauca]|uniref:Uncharacterized protein n=1 Tax=Absidia glauca TaxID=4829 RepID=A0A168RSB8_ABSGL|nr:hypothetical protein [Absidia glauca]
MANESEVYSDKVSYTNALELTGAPPCLDLKSLAQTLPKQCVPLIEQRLRAMQEDLEIITIINNFAQQHNITIKSAANVAEERCSPHKKPLHHIAEHNSQTFKL